MIVRTQEEVEEEALLPDWRKVMRELLQMAKATHVPDQCDCEDIFREAERLLAEPE